MAKEPSPNLERLRGKTVLVVTERPGIPNDFVDELRKHGATIVFSQCSIDKGTNEGVIPDEIEQHKAAAVLIHRPGAIDNPFPRNRTVAIAQALQKINIPLVVVDACITTRMVRIGEHRAGKLVECPIRTALDPYGAAGFGCTASSSEVVDAIADGIAATMENPRPSRGGR